VLYTQKLHESHRCASANCNLVCNEDPVACCPYGSPSRRSIGCTRAHGSVALERWPLAHTGHWVYHSLSNFHKLDCGGCPRARLCHCAAPRETAPQAQHARRGIDSSHVKGIYGRDCTGRNPTDRGRNATQVSAIVASDGVPMPLGRCTRTRATIAQPIGHPCGGTGTWIASLRLGEGRSHSRKVGARVPRGTRPPCANLGQARTLAVHTPWSVRKPWSSSGIGRARTLVELGPWSVRAPGSVRTPWSSSGDWSVRTL